MARVLTHTILALALLVFGLPGMSAGADDPPGVVLLKAMTAPAGTPDAVERRVSEAVTYGGRAGSRVRRGANSAAEMHEGHSHSLVVQRGRGRVVLGGEVVNGSGRLAAANAPGTTIRGGTTYPLSAGDVMFIPANTNHQWLVEAGDDLTYLVVNLPRSATPFAAAHHPAATVPHGTLDPVEGKVSQFVDYGERRGVVVRRGGASKAEIHDDHGHAMVVMQGEGTVILGGTVVDASGKPAKANDVGTTIANGVEYRLTVGDALSFPANTNHQYVGTPGAPFTYFTLNE